MGHTKIDGVRYCSKCTTEVYYCRTDDDVRNARLAGFCVAIDPRLANYNDIVGGEPDDVVLGMLDDA